MNTGGIARGPFFIRLAQTTALSQNRRQVLPRFLNRKRLKGNLGGLFLFTSVPPTSDHSTFCCTCRTMPEEETHEPLSAQDLPR